MLLPGRIAAFQDIRQSRKPESSKVGDFDPLRLSKLAVVVTCSDDQGEQQTTYERLVEDVFLECLLAKGHTVVARSDVAALLKEKSLAESGLTEDTATTVGKFLNVPAVLIVRITEVSTDNSRPAMMVGRVSLTARLLNVETGAVMWTGKHRESDRVTTPAACSRILYKTAAVLAETFPDRGTGAALLSKRTIDPHTVPKLAVLVIGEPRRLTRGASFRGQDPSNPRIKSKAPEGADTDSRSDQERIVEEAFTQVLADRGYRLVSRSDLRAILREQQFQQSGFTEDNAVAIGKLLNIPAVLVVRITDFAVDAIPDKVSGRVVALSRAGVGARIIQVGRGEIWWTHGEWQARQAESARYGSRILDTVATSVASFVPPPPKSDMLAQATRLANLGQVTAAQNACRAVIKAYPNSSEARSADTKLRQLSDR
jgi:hypothetical protein